MSNIRRLTAVVLAVLLLVGCSGGTKSPKPTLYKPYRDDYYGIVYPGEMVYTVEEDEDGIVTFKAAQPDDSTFQIGVVRTKPLLFRDISTEMFESFVEEFLISLQSEPDMTIVSNAKITLKNGRIGHEIVSVFPEAKEKAMAVVTYHKRVVLVIAFQSETRRFEARIPIFTDVLDSLQFF